MLNNNWIELCLCACCWCIYMHESCVFRYSHNGNLTDNKSERRENMTTIPNVAGCILHLRIYMFGCVYLFKRLAFALKVHKSGSENGGRKGKIRTKNDSRLVKNFAI